MERVGLGGTGERMPGQHDRRVKPLQGVGRTDDNAVGQQRHELRDLVVVGHDHHDVVGLEVSEPLRGVEQYLRLA